MPSHQVANLSISKNSIGGLVGFLHSAEPFLARFAMVRLLLSICTHDSASSIPVISCTSERTRTDMAGQVVDSGVGLGARPALEYATLRATVVCCSKGRHGNAGMMKWRKVASRRTQVGTVCFWRAPEVFGKVEERNTGTLIAASGVPFLGTGHGRRLSLPQTWW